MGTKILFTDFDDTLLDSDKTVSKENMEEIHTMLAQGHYVAYTTGRPLQGAKTLVERLGLPKRHCFLLCFQGSVVYDLEQDEILIENPMEQDKMLDLVRLLREKKIYTEAFGKKCFYCFEFTEATRRYNRLTSETYQVIDGIEEIEKEPIYKVMAIDFHNKQPLLELQKSMEEQNPYGFESFFSSEWFYEFCGKNQNKGTGLETLATKLGIPIADTVAVGDEENDLSMIQAAGVGCAVQNARESVKKVADYVTKADHNHGAVAEVIRHFILGDS